MQLKTHRIPGGFSLVEMAIVLVIVGVLLGGLLPTISSQIEQQRRSETRKQMDETLSALMGYAASQTPPKLPCPAKPDIAKGSANAGIADCTLTTGVVPWVELGTSETDAWGRRFTYAVSGVYTTGFTLASSSVLNVLIEGGSSIKVASGVPAVIVSHGTNGLGAYTPQGTQLVPPLRPLSSDSGELDNSNGGTTFVSHDTTSSFDDLVVWLSPNTLTNRMVAAGKLP